MPQPSSPSSLLYLYDPTYFKIKLTLRRDEEHLMKVIFWTEKRKNHLFSCEAYTFSRYLRVVARDI